MATEASAATATVPPGEVKPESPTDLPARSWKQTLKNAVAEFQRDQCTDLAAALTYFSVLSIAPALLALVSLLGVIGRGPQIVDEMLSLLGRLGQQSVAEQLEGPLGDMVASQAAGFTLLIGIATALFSASGYVGAFGRALNKIYEVEEGRPIWKLRPVNVAVTLGLVLMGALVLVGLVVSGGFADALGSTIGLGSQTVFVWGIVKWPVILLIVMAMVATLYYVTPNVQQPSFRYVSPGAVLAILVWVVASVGFGFYVGNFGKYNATYGSLGGVLVLLLWLWLTNIALLLGAELDSELERVRELENGIKAERDLQLPVRDSTQSDKAAEKYEERIAEGRRLRRRATAAGLPETSRRRGRHRRPAEGPGGQRESAAARHVELDPLPSEVARGRRTSRAS